MQLFINRPGSSISRKDGNFDIRHETGRHKISPEQIQSILIAAGTRISSDAILLAVEHEIDLLFVDHHGHPQARIWSHRFGSISSIRKNQVYFATGTAGTRWIIHLLIDRIQGMIQTLDRLDLPAPIHDRVIDKWTILIGTLKQQKDSVPTDQLKSSLRGWEGSAARTYFELISQQLPLPFRFSKRSRRPARDPFNAALNYLYGILYGKIEIALIKAGLDPYLGVFHRDEYNRPVLVYDMIEAYRHWAEQVLVDLCRQGRLSAEMFSPQDEGIWLNQEGKAVIVPACQAYLEQVVLHKGISRSRQQQLQQDCHTLAKTILSNDIC